jgi:hypothetical protein
VDLCHVEAAPRCNLERQTQNRIYENFVAAEQLEKIPKPHDSSEFNIFETISAVVVDDSEMLGVTRQSASSSVYARFQGRAPGPFPGAQWGAFASG